MDPAAQLRTGVARDRGAVDGQVAVAGDARAVAETGNGVARHGRVVEGRPSAVDQDPTTRAVRAGGVARHGAAREGRISTLPGDADPAAAARGHVAGHGGAGEREPAGGEDRAALQRGAVRGDDCVRERQLPACVDSGSRGAAHAAGDVVAAALRQHQAGHRRLTRDAEDPHVSIVDAVGVVVAGDREHARARTCDREPAGADRQLALREDDLAGQAAGERDRVGPGGRVGVGDRVAQLAAVERRIARVRGAIGERVDLERVGRPGEEGGGADRGAGRQTDAPAPDRLAAAFPGRARARSRRRWIVRTP